MDLSKDLKKLIAKQRGYGGGVMRVATAAEVLWEGAAGTVAGPKSAAMEPIDTFEIASVSKMITAVAVMMLVEKGRVGLDDPLGRLLPAVASLELLVVRGRDWTPEITVRQLLGQTSGLPDYWYDPPFVAEEENAFLAAFIANPNRIWAPQDLLAYVPGLTPIGIPGKAGFHYSDTNYVILGLLIESLMGMPLHQALRELLFRPLGMADTYLSYRELPAAAVTESHRFEGRLDLHGRPHQSADWGGGGLVSGTRDLAKFMLALSGGRLLSPAGLSMMQRWEETGETDIVYGLGLYGLQLDGDAGMLWGHDGHGGAFLYYWPERGLLFTGTVNQADSDWWPLVEAALSCFFD
jgi:CubicO group peptidase (beta-lactamase class C family)